MNNYRNIIINEEGEKYLTLGQMWLYRNNVKYVDTDIINGSAVNLVNDKGDYFGSGFVSLNSHITVRILTKDCDEIIDLAFFEKRIRFAVQYRMTIMRDNFSNCRMVFGEADELPGLIVDRYNDVLVTQISSYGLEMIKDKLYFCLLKVLKEFDSTINYIYERNDISIRTKEGLSEYKGFYGETTKTITTINENGLLINVDIENGQKTGYFLDQKANRVLLRNISYGKKVLDCFSHTGGFALNAAYGGACKVVAVDVSQKALDKGYENAVLNGIDKSMNFVQDDVFDYLDNCPKGEFDIIVLDPPAFTKSRKTIYKAYNGYKRINYQAMKILNKGGYLITCSCSRYMETANFEKMLKEAASEANVVLKQVSVTQQSADHPILWNMEETSYLKYYIFQII
ncbi:MAG: class I SAM-dependent rRNA methyltransferase [Erysipelotrichaceae bacterium]